LHGAICPSENAHGAMIRIETDRLTIRRMQDEDLETFFEYDNHPEHTRHLSRSAYTQDQAREFIQTQHNMTLGTEGQYHHLSVELKSTGEMIGTVCINLTSKRHRQGDIGWFLGADHHGHGYATEASRAMLEFGFDTLDLNRITAICHATNTRSFLLMERLGMRREACFVQASYFDGEWHNQYAYAILKADVAFAHRRFGCPLMPIAPPLRIIIGHHLRLHIRDEDRHVAGLSVPRHS
jgi:RimJ/RimL family protein N-acetyltransferase